MLVRRARGASAGQLRGGNGSTCSENYCSGPNRVDKSRTIVSNVLVLAELNIVSGSSTSIGNHIGCVDTSVGYACSTVVPVYQNEMRITYKCDSSDLVH